MHRHNIVQEFSTEYYPEQNGRIERQNRTIVEMACTILATAELPLSLWGEASNTAALIRNFLLLNRLNRRTHPGKHGMIQSLTLVFYVCLTARHMP